MVDKVREKINQVLDVSDDIEASSGSLVTVNHGENREDDIQDDYAKRREVLYDLIEKGNQALASSLHVANGSQHPRAFEVTGQLIKTVADVAKDLTELQQSMDKLEGMDKEKKSSGNVTQNAIFVGSTSELLKALKDQ